MELTFIDFQELFESTDTAFSFSLTVDFEQVDNNLKAAAATATATDNDTSFDGPGCSRDCRTVGDDVVCLRQVMRNLISNAIKLTPAESGEIRVRASCWVNLVDQGKTNLGQVYSDKWNESVRPRRLAES